MAARQADWLLVGEPPDEAEERAGAAFADQSGQLLDNMLKALGLSRRADAAGSAQAAYLTNVVKCRPARARNPEPAELVVCENYLRREIALVQPKVILAMGRFAAQALLQSSAPELTGTPLGKLRGQIYRYQGLPVVVTYHPAYLLRNQADKARAWADLCLARQAAAGRL
jgi:DNA polymerase